jgi:hypothetical protein
MKVPFRAVSMLLVLPALMLLVASSGCGKSAGPGGVASVDGKVIYKGNPVTGGKVTFHPQGGGPGFTIDLRPDGTFFNGDVAKEAIGPVTITVETKHLKDLPGGDPTDFEVLAKEGKEKGIAIKKVDKSGPGLTEMGKSPAQRPVYVAIPEKYADKKLSGLTWEIKAGKNQRTIELN